MYIILLGVIFAIGLLLYYIFSTTGNGYGNGKIDKKNTEKINKQHERTESKKGNVIYLTPKSNNPEDADTKSVASEHTNIHDDVPDAGKDSIRHNASDENPKHDK